MIKGIYQSARNLQAKMKNIEIVANNLANINTTAYKREIPFSELMNRFADNRYSQITDFSQGSTVQTGNSLHMAISGEGFFMIETPRGVGLTRNGNFTINEEGFLVDQSGRKVIGDDGPINLTKERLKNTEPLEIKKNGEIWFGKEQVGRILIANVENQKLLERGEDNLSYAADNNYKEADEMKFNISQGYLEESNVNPIVEMQEMIALQKEYEASSKIIQSMDQQLGRTMEAGRV